VKLPDRGKVLISACLAGVPCTHEAEPKTRAWAVRLVAEGRAVLVCPEVAGGLPIPRPEAEITGGDGHDVLTGAARVINSEGGDVTESYLRGARVAVREASSAGSSVAVLKARSPSCGCGRIHDGTFSGTLRDGDGVTTAALRREGIDVIDDEAVEDEQRTQESDGGISRRCRWRTRPARGPRPERRGFVRKAVASPT
jgi:uncharacterized protein YbbK (DUF523 family)